MGKQIALRSALVVFGLLLLALSWIERDHSALATVYGGGGIFLVMLGALLPHVQEVRAPGFGANFVPQDVQERRAVLEAADVETPPEAIEQRFQSSDPGPPTTSPEDPEIIGTLRYLAGSLAVEGILEFLRSQPALSGCDVRLYLFDAEREGLYPVSELPDDERHEGFAIGQGATGAAWASGETVVVTGAATSDSTYGLSTTQQQRFADLRSVAAEPVFSEDSEVIAVLTVATTDPALNLSSDDARTDLTLGALLLSRVLINLFGWFDD